MPFEFIPEKWADALIAPFHKNLVFGNLVNRDYEGLITGSGDTVNIGAIGPVTVNDYTSTVTYETISDASVKMLIDQGKYWAFRVKDIEKAQSNVDFMAAAGQEAGYAMANAVDTAIGALYTEVPTANILSSLALKTNLALNAILTMKQYLDIANAPQEGRWLVVPPIVATKIIMAKCTILDAGVAADGFVNGYIGSVAGFNVYTSNNVAVSTTYRCLAGTKDAITFAGQITEGPENIRDYQYFDTLVRGLYVYGLKVVRPNCLGVIDCSVVAD
jgi:hypothetical protein